MACKCLDTTDGEAARKGIPVRIGITTVEAQVGRFTCHIKGRRPITTVGSQIDGTTSIAITETCSRQNKK